jgi:hypothetical protein
LTLGYVLLLSDALVSPVVVGFVNSERFESELNKSPALYHAGCGNYAAATAIAYTDGTGHFNRASFSTLPGDGWAPCEFSITKASWKKTVRFAVQSTSAYLNSPAAFPVA